MDATDIHVVTGAFGYSGRRIADRLLQAGKCVRTLTNRPSSDSPFGDAVEAFPLDFSDADGLARAMQGASVLYNTYWVRFNHRMFNHEQAVANTLTLFQAARQAGVRRIVHVSILNPSDDSPLSYFRGKARLEDALINSGLSYAILRPAVLFGGGDILINNIAWMLRRSPVFGLFGNGRYRLQPIHVDDFASLATGEGGGSDNRIIAAIGPETFTFRELVQRIGSIIGRPRLVVSLPPAVGHSIGYLVGKVTGDVVITRDEIKGLMADLLHTDAPPAGTTKLTDWVAEHADSLGRHYASELARRPGKHRP